MLTHYSRGGSSMRSIILCLLAASIPSTLKADEWQAVTTELLQKEKPGYGGLSGVAIDRASGNVFVNVSDRGVFRSSDQGKTWTRLGKEIKGRTETPGCLQLDPTGKSKRIMMATVYGGPIVVGASDAGNWRPLAETSRHIDWCAVDWTDPDFKFILGLKHESGGVLIRSRDGGKTFDELGKGHGPAWVFNADTAVVALAKSKERPKGSLVRTTDGGKTFQPCGDYGPVAAALARRGALLARGRSAHQDHHRGRIVGESV